MVVVVILLGLLVLIAVLVALLKGEKKTATYLAMFSLALVLLIGKLLG